MEQVIQYVARTSILHRLDPRTKIIGLSFLLIGFTQIHEWIQLVFSAFVVGLLYHFAQIPFSYALHSIRPLLLILLLTLLYHSMFSGITYLAGFLMGLHYVLKLLMMILSGVLLTATTKPLELALGLETMLRPLEKWRIPVGQWALMIVLALRFFPLIIEEWERIRLSQQARGITIKRFRQRLYSPVQQVIPLLLALITRAERLSIAIEARRFRQGFNRTHFHLLAFQKKDGYCILFPIFVSIIVLLL